MKQKMLLKWRWKSQSNLNQLLNFSAYYIISDYLTGNSSKDREISKSNEEINRVGMIPNPTTTKKHLSISSTRNQYG